MHPMRRMEEIKSSVEGEMDASAIRGAAKLLEASMPAAAVLGPLASEEFLPAILRAAEGRPAAEERAWLTLAAAGPRRARLSLAWRASQLLDAEELVEAFVANRDDLRGACRRRAARSAEEDVQAAWLLLSWLTARQLRRLLRGRPRLAACYRRMVARRSETRRPATEPISVGLS